MLKAITTHLSIKSTTAFEGRFAFSTSIPPKKPPSKPYVYVSRIARPYDDPKPAKRSQSITETAFDYERDGKKITKNLMVLRGYLNESISLQVNLPEDIEASIQFPKHLFLPFAPFYFFEKVLKVAGVINSLAVIGLAVANKWVYLGLWLGVFTFPTLSVSALAISGYSLSMLIFRHTLQTHLSLSEIERTQLNYADAPQAITRDVYLWSFYSVAMLILMAPTQQPFGMMYFSMATLQVLGVVGFHYHVQMFLKLASIKNYNCNSKTILVSLAIMLMFLPLVVLEFYQEMYTYLSERNQRIYFQIKDAFKSVPMYFKSKQFAVVKGKKINDMDDDLLDQ